VLAPDLTIIAASDAYLRATGTGREAITGRPIFDTFPERPDPGGIATLRASLDRVRASAAADTIAVQRYDLGQPGSGEPDSRYWSLMNAPVVIAGGEVGFIIHWLTDVTEYVQLNQGQGADLGIPPERRARAQWMEANLLARSRDLQEANRALEQANQALRSAYDSKKEFLDRLGHELRTPLNTVLGFGELLSLEDTSAEHRDWLRMMMQASRHLVQLLDQVRDASRIEERTLALSMEAIPVHGLIADVLELVRPLSLSCGVQLNAPAAAAATQFIKADEDRLRQVLLNLLTNAVKYNHPAGTVTVAVAKRAGDRLRISVTDTGRGIADPDLKRLFLPFERLDAAQAGIQGTGLDLALSRDLIEAMGGTTGVSSKEGEGSTFWVELPATEPVAVAQLSIERDAVTRSRPYTAARTVLYVEDMVENLRLVEQILRQRPSVNLLSAMLGGVAIDLAREHHPDMILLDLRLPDMPGDEMLRTLRADPATSDIPVVILSADATGRRADQLRTDGIHDYLTKPIDVHSLLQAVDSALGETPPGPAAEPAPAAIPARGTASGYWRGQ
jgi:signal transduction histidine kinase/ActR/RegA family two-component response regulator